MKEKIRETVRTIIDEEVNKPQVGYFWKGLALFLMGVVVGFYLSPIKKGVRIGCNNGNNCTDSGKITGSGNPLCKGKKAEDEDVDSGNYCAD